MTTLPTLELSEWADGQTDPQIPVNAMMAGLELLCGGYIAIPLTGLGTPIHADTGSISSNTYRQKWLTYHYIRFTGTLASNVQFIVPTNAKRAIVENATSGSPSFAITVKTSGGTGIAVPQGGQAELICDGTNIISGPSGGLVFTETGGGLDLYFYGSKPGVSDAGEELFTIVMLGTETFPASLTGSRGGCETAPTGSVTCQFKKNGSNIGTMNIASGATTATFTFASPVSPAAGDRISLYAPNPADASLAGIFYTIKATR